jgi:ribosomal protein L3
MGGERVTVQQLEVVGIKDDGITLKGLIPGSRNGLVEIKTHRN